MTCLLLVITRMATKTACRTELSELVSDHIFRHIYRNVLAAVVHGDRVTHEIRQDRGTSRPRLHDLLVVRRIERVNFLHETFLYERSLLD